MSMKSDEIDEVSLELSEDIIGRIQELFETDTDDGVCKGALFLARIFAICSHTLVELSTGNDMPLEITRKLTFEAMRAFQVSMADFREAIANRN